MATNWRGMQAFGCKTPHFHEPRDVLPGHLSGGCWRANLFKDGTLYQRSHGGTRKPKKKTSKKISYIPPQVEIDKKGYVVLS